MEIRGNYYPRDVFGLAITPTGSLGYAEYLQDNLRRGYPDNTVNITCSEEQGNGIVLDPMPHIAVYEVYRMFFDLHFQEWQKLPKEKSYKKYDVLTTGIHRQRRHYATEMYLRNHQREGVREERGRLPGGVART